MLVASRSVAIHFSVSILKRSDENVNILKNGYSSSFAKENKAPHPILSAFTVACRFSLTFHLIPPAMPANRPQISIFGILLYFSALRRRCEPTAEQNFNRSLLASVCCRRESAS